MRVGHVCYVMNFGQQLCRPGRKDRPVRSPGGGLGRKDRPVRSPGGGLGRKDRSVRSPGGGLGRKDRPVRSLGGGLGRKERCRSVAGALREAWKRLGASQDREKEQLQRPGALQGRCSGRIGAVAASGSVAGALQ